ncbi:MAG: sugar phosphate isomerase/epimerase [Calditrichaeota bacterium]|nr:sugar phosphate isomerase/epimerase [Calditrichota bacterium]
MRELLLADDSQIEAACMFCYREGLGIEIQSFWDTKRIEEFPRLATQHLRFLGDLSPRAFHGHFADLNGGSHDALIREASRIRLLSGMHWARELGATRVVFHGGFVPGTSPPLSWIPRMTAFWHGLLSDAPSGMCFHLENQLDPSPEILRDLIDSIADERVSACLDVGHAHCNSTVPVPRWVQVLGARVGHVHLHDNDGTRDQHRALGSGTLPLGETLAALDEHAPDAAWVLETSPAGWQASLDWLKEGGHLGANR